jgi:CheY-like chemotaxis protein
VPIADFIVNENFFYMRPDGAALALLEIGRFDIALMDLEMPEMDGVSATQAIREREKTTGTHLPIVAMTAHAMNGDEGRCLSAGMDGYVSKPIRPERLFEVIKMCLQEAEPAPGIKSQ